MWNEFWGNPCGNIQSDIWCRLVGIVTANLFRNISDQYSLSTKGIHGIAHWARVLANGRKLARQTGANMNVVELFAVFHDSRRLSDARDPEHGLRGGRLAVEKRGDWFDISDGEMDLLFKACAYHTDGATDGDITVQTCWDADRLDIGRVGMTPIPERLCTDVAKSPEMLNWAHHRRYSWEWGRWGGASNAR